MSHRQSLVSPGGVADGQLVGPVEVFADQCPSLTSIQPRPLDLLAALVSPKHVPATRITSPHEWPAGCTQMGEAHSAWYKSAWNAFLCNVFNFMAYLRWRGKLLHAKEPKRGKLVKKISITVLGKRVYSHEREDAQKKSWDLLSTVELSCEQPFALEHTCWVIAVYLTRVIWEHYYSL